jgi:hypothetical protein
MNSAFSALAAPSGQRHTDVYRLIAGFLAGLVLAIHDGRLFC